MSVQLGREDSRGATKPYQTQQSGRLDEVKDRWVKDEWLCCYFNIVLT